eukprot:maker-scaffold_2-snap-gene-6.50-mRNA-1 protein AED:0.00 eAED:0.00 QI:126/1/1/1/1/1/2/446/349
MIKTEEKVFDVQTSRFSIPTFSSLKSWLPIKPFASISFNINIQELARSLFKLTLRLFFGTTEIQRILEGESWHSAKMSLSIEKSILLSKKLKEIKFKLFKQGEKDMKQFDSDDALNEIIKIKNLPREAEVMTNLRKCLVDYSGAVFALIKLREFKTSKPERDELERLSKHYNHRTRTLSLPLRKLEKLNSLQLFYLKYFVNSSIRGKENFSVEFLSDCADVTYFLIVERRFDILFFKSNDVFLNALGNIQSRSLMPIKQTSILDTLQTILFSPNERDERSAKTKHFLSSLSEREIIELKFNIICSRIVHDIVDVVRSKRSEGERDFTPDRALELVRRKYGSGIWTELTL